MPTAMQQQQHRDPTDCEEGASPVASLRDETFPKGGDGLAHLHRWASEGCLELVNGLLETPNEINFRALDEEGNTPFHAVLCGGAKSDEEVRALMGALVERLDSHLHDTGEDADESGLTLWEVRNAVGRDVLHLAIATGHLSVVYPLVKDRPHYRDLLTKDAPLLLDFEPIEEDWMKLRVDDRNKLQPPSVTVYKEVLKDQPDLAVVKHYLRGGADVLHWPDGALNPILHACVQRRHTEVLDVLLETERDIDFTVKGHGSRTPLHYVCHYYSDEVPHSTSMVTMTAAIVRRLATHPRDLVDWSMVDLKGRDFLSLAAKHHELSHLYPLVKHQPYFVNAAKPLVLQYRPDAEDWALLSDADRSELRGARKQEDVNRRLYDEVEENDSPDIGAVRRYVNGGADPLYCPNGAYCSSLHYCAVKSQVEVVEEMLETKRDMDFTVKGLGGLTPLHCVCDYVASEPPHTPDAMKAMTGAIVRRLATHPRDLVDWGIIDRKGLDFLSLAAREGVLSHLYPLVKHQPYFVNAAKPLVLQYRPDAEDWALLSDADRSELRGSRKQEDVNRRLYDAVCDRSDPDIGAVRRYVNGGADPLYRPVGAQYPTLHRCILKGNAEVLLVLLETERDMDFTVKGLGGRTPLHCVCDHYWFEPPNSTDVMVMMTGAIVRRLVAHPRDLVDWKQKTKEGLDFASFAARAGVLSVLYPLMKDQLSNVNAVWRGRPAKAADQSTATRIQRVDEQWLKSRGRGKH